METTLRQALESLSRHLGPLDVAPLYRTAPVLKDTSPTGLSPHPPQPDYLNTAAVGATDLPPASILELAKRLERRHGRDPEAPRDAPRPLDIDLLLYGMERSDHPELTLPHPRMSQRRFVLVPLAMIAPNWPVPDADEPGIEHTVRQVLEACPDRSRVERIPWRQPPSTGTG